MAIQYRSLAPSVIALVLLVFIVAQGMGCKRIVTRRASPDGGDGRADLGASCRDVHSPGVRDVGGFANLLGILVADAEVVPFLHLVRGELVPVSCEGCDPSLLSAHVNGVRLVAKGEGDIVCVRRFTARGERVVLDFTIKREGVRGEMIYELRNGKWVKVESHIVEEK